MIDVGCLMDVSLVTEIRTANHHFLSLARSPIKQKVTSSAKMCHMEEQAVSPKISYFQTCAIVFMVKTTNEATQILAVDKAYDRQIS